MSTANTILSNTSVKRSPGSCQHQDPPTYLGRSPARRIDNNIVPKACFLSEASPMRSVMARCLPSSHLRSNARMTYFFRSQRPPSANLHGPSCSDDVRNTVVHSPSSRSPPALASLHPCTSKRLVPPHHAPPSSFFRVRRGGSP